MSTMTLNDAYSICEPIYPGLGQAALNKRSAYSAWVEKGQDMSSVPDLVKDIARAAGCSIIHSTHLMKILADESIQGIMELNAITIADLPVYQMVKAFYEKKLHANDSSGQAWSGALYGRKKREKPGEYHDGLIDILGGEYPAMIAFYCLFNGLSSIQKIRQMTGIAWATLKEWIAAAIRHINFFKELRNPIAAMGTLRAKDFCLGIFSRNKAAQGQSNRKVNTDSDVEDSVADAEFVEDGGFDDGGGDDKHKRNDRHGEKTDREVTAEIIALNISHFSKATAKTQSEIRMRSAIQEIDKSMLISALATPENATNFFSLLWQWASRQEGDITKNMLDFGPARIVRYLVKGVKNDFIIRDGDVLGYDPGKIWNNVVDDKEHVVFLHRAATSAETKKMHFNLETDEFITVLVKPEKELVDYFVRNSFWRLEQGKKFGEEAVLKRIQDGRFVIRRDGDGATDEIICCQVRYHPRKTDRIMRDGAARQDDEDDNGCNGNALWDSKVARSHSDWRGAPEPDDFDAGLVELKGLEFQDYQKLGKLLGLPPAVIRSGLAGDDEKYQALLLAIQKLLPDQRAEAQEMVTAMLMPAEN
ncbi:hypothetical protein JKG47_01240 [Acidithiobacillus sp. MC6.1]|nr:hypothetical protein [Acidithiobacillus sp. MC6.1]